MNPAIGKDLIQSDNAVIQMQYDAQLKKLAVNRALLRGNLNDYYFLLGNPDVPTDYEQERQFLTGRERQERYDRNTLTQSLITEIMGAQDTVFKSDIEARLEGLSQGQKLAIQKLLPNVNSSELIAAIQAALESKTGLKAFIKGKTTPILTKNELENLLQMQ